MIYIRLNKENIGVWKQYFVIEMDKASLGTFSDYPMDSHTDEEWLEIYEDCSVEEAVQEELEESIRACL